MFTSTCIYFQAYGTIYIYCRLTSMVISKLFVSSFYTRLTKLWRFFEISFCATFHNIYMHVYTCICIYMYILLIFCTAAAIQDAKSTNQQAVGAINSTTLAKNASTPVVPADASVTTANVTKNTTDNTTIVATVPAAATTTATNVTGNKENNTRASEQSTSTASATSTTTVTAAPTTLSTTAKQPPIPANCTTTDTNTTTTTAKPTNTTTTITTPTTNNASNVSSTTAIPVSTKVAPPSPYKERQFDGLSFLGK